MGKKELDRLYLDGRPVGIIELDNTIEYVSFDKEYQFCLFDFKKIIDILEKRKEKRN